MNKNSKLIIETIAVFAANCFIAVFFMEKLQTHIIYKIIYVPFLLFQGLWFYRFYIVGHEAAHKKLIPDNLTRNDFWGSVILIPILVPINIYRKIHYFHHGFNRKDDHTSALDTFVIKGKMKDLKKVYYFTIWYISVFLGGFFIHSLVSVVLFLFVPVSLTVKISDAFRGWTWKDQLKSVALFLLGVAFHLTIFFVFGKNVYLFTLGIPMLSFGWVLSLLVYIFHYDTTKGDSVRFNVRSVKRIPLFSWVLMNFNEHATHHQYPNIPWHDLPNKRTDLPEEFDQKNQNTWNFFKAIINQIKGPDIVYEK